MSSRIPVYGLPAVVVWLALAVTPAPAADMTAPFNPVAAVEPKVDFATGWYIRGSAGAALETVPTLTGDITNVLNNTRTPNWTVEVGAGYQFNNSIRVDSTLGYYGDRRTFANGPSVNCYQSINGQYAANGTTPQGLYAVPSQCTPVEAARLRKWLLLANGYYDIGTWYGVTPYVGAGVGTAILYETGQVNYINNSNGSPYNASLTLPSGFPVIYNNAAGVPLSPQPRINYGTQNWNTSSASLRINFAWALMAGFAYDLTSNLKLDVGYRYVDFGKMGAINPATGQSTTMELNSHEAHIGLRYMLD